jgi:hypothetical protein
MNDKTYNGWTNYETWVINLWMSNEEGTYRYWQEATADEVLGLHVYRVMRDHDEEDEKQSAISDLADRLKSEHEEGMPEVEGVWSDLLTAALGEVNWREIASHLVDDYHSRVRP